jgi:hypothetical protein
MMTATKTLVTASVNGTTLPETKEEALAKLIKEWAKLDKTALADLKVARVLGEQWPLVHQKHFSEMKRKSFVADVLKKSFNQALKYERIFQKWEFVSGCKSITEAAAKAWALSRKIKEVFAIAKMVRQVCSLKQRSSRWHNL